MYHEQFLILIRCSTDDIPYSLHDTVEAAVFESVRLQTRLLNDNDAFDRISQRVVAFPSDLVGISIVSFKDGLLEGVVDNLAVGGEPGRFTTLATRRS